MTGPAGPAVFGVTGWKNSGKTTLMEGLVRTISKRGFAVSTIKHAHHQFDVDQEGTDSYRHRQAGAVEVALVSGYRWALMHELRGNNEPALDDILARMSDCDLVLIEGYKSASHLKIEVRLEQARRADPLWQADPQIVAIAADRPIDDCPLPVFNLNDIDAIAEFVMQKTNLDRRDDPR
jgi:molybdopterin-guanine dinucleotide biosynthesis protein B